MDFKSAQTQLHKSLAGECFKTMGNAGL